MIKNYLQRSAVICFIASLALNVWAQIPAGYYDDAFGKKERTLKTALSEIISDHVVRSYKQLWTDFQSTDRRADGKVWDMYSSATSYTFISDQCGNYSGEGSCYNREHSLPKSWFDDASPMYTDLYHLYPTDGYVNGRRSNHPFGETNNPTYTSGGGFSKVGPCSFPGYTGTVFEPDDEYKGDMARTYFYMATCYESRISTWSSAMLANNRYPAFTGWAIELLLKWSREDPVSQKEINRNEAVYKIQENRNPFIDYPELAEYIWGNKTTQAFQPGSATTVATPEFSPEAGTYMYSVAVSLTCATPDATIYYTVDGTMPSSSSTRYQSPINLTETTTVKAIAYKEGMTTSEVATATYLILHNDPTYANSITELRQFNADGQTEYTVKLTDAVVTYRGGLFLFIQDSEAGIVIYGNTDRLPGALKEGDIVSGEVAGTLKDYNSMLELIPTKVTITITGNQPDIVPLTVTTDELVANFAQYDSRLIRLDNILFTASEFTNKNVTVEQTGSTARITCRDHFENVNISPLPTTPVTLKGLAIKHYDTVQIALRGDKDIITDGSNVGTTGKTEIAIFTLRGKMIITVEEATPIEVYDVLGRCVLRTIIETGGTTIELPSGLYIVNGSKVIL